MVLAANIAVQTADPGSSSPTLTNLLPSPGKAQPPGFRNPRRTMPPFEATRSPRADTAGGAEHALRPWRISCMIERTNHSLMSKYEQPIIGRGGGLKSLGRHPWLAGLSLH